MIVVGLNLRWKQQNDTTFVLMSRCCAKQDLLICNHKVFPLIWYFVQIKLIPKVAVII